MQNFPVMQSLKSSNNLYENVPNLLLFDIGLPLLITANFLEYVSIIGIFHHQAFNFEIVIRKRNLPQTRAWLIDECLLVSDDIGLIDTCQNPHLVEGILFLFIGQVEHFNLFQSVNVIILGPSDLVN